MRATLPDIYVLTDARGFTTCITGAPSHELARVPLLVPIEVAGFSRHGHGNGIGAYTDYRSVPSHTYTWDGMIVSWR